MALSRILKAACQWSSTLALASTLAYAAGSFTGSLNTLTTVASTIPANGDVNPYGVAIVPRTTGNLTAGNILVSNFNNSSNLQGTGTTIVQISPGGALSVFAQIPQDLEGCPGGVGLTTALVVLRSGWVIVGSLPTSDGTSATMKAGCLIVLDRNGHIAETFAGKRDGVAINGPWDMTALDTGGLVELFVTNVLDGTVAANGTVVNRGTVVRILLLVDERAKPQELLRTEIGSGFPQRTDPAALVIGATGVGLGGDGTLYVADSLSNRIAAIPNAVFRFDSAGIGDTVSENGALNGPLGLAIAPNGDILTADSGDGNLVETTPEGKQVVVKDIDVSDQGAGTLFGLAVVPGGVYYVDDGNNTLNLLN
jgi:hypothetical protein